MGDVSLSVVAPGLNEAGNFPELATRLLHTFDRYRIPGEVILVNDGSTDQSQQVINDLAHTHARVVAVHHEKNQGIVPSWKDGIEKARGTYVCLIDSDLQNLPEDVGRLFSEIQFCNADVVQGYRSSTNRDRDSRYLLSRGLNVILNYLFGMKSRDNKSGFVIARKEVLLDILHHRYSYFYFQTFIAVAAHNKGYSIKEIETLFESRLVGKSFIPSVPLKLLARCLVDLAKGWVEFRLFPMRESILSRLLQRSPKKSPLFSRSPQGKILLSIFFLTMPFHKWLISRRAKQYLTELEQSQWLSPQSIRELQEEKLRKMILHAYHHVAYYRDLFHRSSIDPRNIQTLEDLSRLPLLSKDDIREHLHFGLLSDNHRKDRILKISTSGSTGEPLVCYADDDQLELRWAATLRSMEWTGYQFGDRQARLWHQTLGMSPKQIWKERLDALLSRRLFIPAFTMNKDNIEKIFDRIERHRPTLLDGYAESFNLLAEYILSTGRTIHGVKAIISSAQELPRSSRERIEEAFRCRVFDKYGSREFSGIAYECNAHEGHHVIAENCIVEILRDGKRALPGDVGEIVITDLNNYCMPLIRYRIGDLAIAREEGVLCSCGRGLPMIGDIVGRTQAIIVGADGRYLPSAFFGHFFKDYAHLIRQYQVVQEQVGTLTLKIVRGLRYTDSSFDELVTFLRQHVGEGMQVQVEFVSEIPLVRTGKHRSVVSHVETDFQKSSQEAVIASVAKQTPSQ